MSKEEIKDLFNQIGNRFGNDVLKGTHLSSIVKDIQPNIHPAYFNILKELERKQLVKTVSELDENAAETVFELIKLRSDFKENNGFDNKAYDVFDAVCEIFDFQLDFTQSTPHLPTANVTSLQFQSTLNETKYGAKRRLVSIAGKMTSHDIPLMSNLKYSAVDFLNEYQIKKQIHGDSLHLKN
jgi:hypothetical protein